MRKLATLLLATIACSSGTVGIDDEPVAPRSEVKFHEVGYIPVILYQEEPFCRVCLHTLF